MCVAMAFCKINRRQRERELLYLLEINMIST
jgi:hypothetical protein